MYSVQRATSFSGRFPVAVGIPQLHSSKVDIIQIAGAPLVTSTRRDAMLVNYSWFRSLSLGLACSRWKSVVVTMKCLVPAMSDLQMMRTP
jgi:hypothetical protein